MVVEEKGMNQVQRKEGENKILVLLGSSASGKDTVAKILARRNKDLKIAISTTTRPKRELEKDGVDYYFISKEEFILKMARGAFWEFRVYHTLVNGEPDSWFYALEKDKTFLEEEDYILVIDRVGYRELKNKLGSKIVSVYIDAPVSARKIRAMSRDKNFDQTEWERRVSDDNNVFENIEEEVDYVVENIDLEKCVNQVEKIYRWHA